jgi:deoxyribodipyrimidine photolyase-related protein
MTAALLLFPHQLFESNRALAKGRHVYLVEDPLFFDQYAFHQQKLVLHRATMRMHADFLREPAARVSYLDSAHAPAMREVFAALLRDGVREVHVIDPVDDWLQQRLDRALRETGLRAVVHDTPMFLCTPGFLHRTLGGRRKLRMAQFYMQQRRDLGVLMEGGKPAGGRWSFDADNRKRLPKEIEPPGLPAVAGNAYVTEAQRYVAQRYAGNPGCVAQFAYPVTYADARAWLRDFLQRRFALFGDYEDAISSRSRTLFHSVLTPMLNTGLLTPREVLDAALEHARAQRLPLNSLEGFVRQVIGWREFMRGAYVFNGRAQRTRNFWGHRRRVPQSFWTGATGIAPVDLVIRRVLDHAYAHHIERLMVLANFMLLCELDPDDVYRWFMEMFIDAYDWVMVPNVYGMALHADGGLITTKPYISASSYILRMSDFGRGPWCEVWDGLFWRFIAQHAHFFEANPRLAVMSRQLERMDGHKRRAHLAAAEGFLAKLH